MGKAHRKMFLGAVGDTTAPELILCGSALNSGAPAPFGPAHSVPAYWPCGIQLRLVPDAGAEQLLPGWAKVDETAARRRALVTTDAVDVVVKYEGHFQRQLAQVLHELERRQALRSDRPPHPPVAVDVTVHAAEEGVTTPLPLGG